MRPRFSTPTLRGSFLALFTAMLVVASMPAIALAAIPNDHPEQAEVVTELPFFAAQDTSGATDSPDDPECAAGDGHSVWFSYTPDSTIDVYANTFGSDYDTTLSVYVDDAGSLLQVACNDDAGEWLESEVFWSAEAGVTYLIMVGAFGDWPGGNLAFSMGEGSAPPPVEISVTVTGASVNRRTGETTLHGEVACSEYAAGLLYGEVRQRVGRFFITGYVEELFECDVEPTTWSAPILLQTGTFTGGWIHVSGAAFVFDGTGDTTFETDARLRTAH